MLKYCYVSDTGKQGSFIRVLCSQLYKSNKINAPGHPSLHHIQKLEKKFIDNKLHQTNSNRPLYSKTKIYKPLILPSNTQQDENNYNKQARELANAVWEIVHGINMVVNLILQI